MSVQRQECSPTVFLCSTRTAEKGTRWPDSALGIDIFCARVQVSVGLRESQAMLIGETPRQLPRNTFGGVSVLSDCASNRFGTARTP